MRKRYRRPIGKNNGCELTAIWISVGVLLLLEILMWCFVGSPLRTLRLVRGGLPLWLFGLLEWICCALGGISMGRLLTEYRLREETRFRSAFFLVMALTFGYFWYALFFGAFAFFLSFLFALLASIAYVFAILSAGVRRCTRFPTMLIGLAWFLYRMFFSLFGLFFV